MQIIRDRTGQRSIKELQVLYEITERMVKTEKITVHKNTEQKMLFKNNGKFR